MALQDADFATRVSILRAKKCPHTAGINPFLGGDGGDKNHSTLVSGALQQLFMSSGENAYALFAVSTATAIGLFGNHWLRIPASDNDRVRPGLWCD